jgi:hypothetical protein
MLLLGESRDIAVTVYPGPSGRVAMRFVLVSVAIFCDKKHERQDIPEFRGIWYLAEFCMQESRNQSMRPSPHDCTESPTCPAITTNIDHIDHGHNLSDLP